MVHGADVPDRRHVDGNRNKTTLAYLLIDIDGGNLFRYADYLSVHSTVRERRKPGSGIYVQENIHLGNLHGVSMHLVPVHLLHVDEVIGKCTDSNGHHILVGAAE